MTRRWQRERTSVEKPKLGLELNARLKQHYGALKMAAKKIGIRYPSLRQDLWQGRFIEEDLLKLCAALGLPQEITKLQAQYEFELKKGPRGLRKLERTLRAKVDSKGGTLADVFNTLEGRIDHVEQFVESAKEIIPLFFSCLGKSDALAIFISDDLPTHWDRAEATNWIRPFAEKLKAGTRVIYLYPSNTLTTEIMKTGYSGMFTSEQVQTRFERFKRDLAGVLPSNAAVLDENLCCVEHKCPYVCAPQHRYVLYFFTADGRPQVRSTGTFPIALHHGEVERPSQYLVVPLNRLFTGILQDACVTALQNRVDEITVLTAKEKLAGFLKAVTPH
jgi:hypothetical protein